MGISDDDRETLREMAEKDWVRAGLAGDWDTALTLCSDDLAYMPPDHPMCHGKDEAREYLTAFPPILDFSQKLTVIEGTPELTVIEGTFEVSTDMDGERVTGRGKVLTTATREHAGWKITRVCFNFDEPLA